MNRLKLYLETSVWNFYFAEDASEKRDVTLEFFRKAKQFDIFISEVVFREIGNASAQKRKQLETLIEKFAPGIISVSPAAFNLAKDYIDSMALPARALEDALHAAVCTDHGMDALLSWNMKHLANLRRKQNINAVNLKNGYYKMLEIITPEEVIYNENE